MFIPLARIRGSPFLARLRRGCIRRRRWCAPVNSAGFNEGNWPPRPDMDPWMNSAMRAGLGYRQKTGEVGYGT